MCQFGHVHVGEVRRTAGGNVACRLGDAQQGSRQFAGEQPGDHPGCEQHRQAGDGDRALDGMDLRVDEGERR